MFTQMYRVGWFWSSDEALAEMRGLLPRLWKFGPSEPWAVKNVDGQWTAVIELTEETLDRVEIDDEDGCWPWQSALPAGLVEYD